MEERLVSTINMVSIHYQHETHACINLGSTLGGEIKQSRIHEIVKRTKLFVGGDRQMNHRI